MTDVFISYASEDRERAARLAAALEARGWSIWWDRKIITGQAYDQTIEHALAGASCVVVLWSRHSLASEWVKNEASAGADRGVLLPAVIEPVSAPLEFRRRQSADLSDWDDEPDHAGLQALCAGIQATLGRLPATGLPSRAPAARPARRLVAGFAIGGVVLLVIGAYYAGSRRASPASSLSDGIVATAPSERAAAAADRDGRSAAPSAGTNGAATTAGTSAVIDLESATRPAREPATLADDTTNSSNLLAAENGGQLMAAPHDDWAAAIDGKLNQYASVRVGEAAVFAFKDDKPARFHTFGILINNSGRNPKELELLVGDDSPTGTFRSIGVFHPENIKLFKTGGWQDFRFPPVKARYLKVRFNSNFEDVVWIHLVELRLLGAPS